MRIRLLLGLGLILVILVSVSCAAFPRDDSSSFENKLNAVVHPYIFSITAWEFNTAFNAIKQKIAGSQPAAILDSQSVILYFSYITQWNKLKSDFSALQAKKVFVDSNLYNAKIADYEARLITLKPVAEQTLAHQISQILADQGIYNSIADNWFKLTFPPVNFKLEKPLNVLIVSPRDRIERIRDITIKPDISAAQVEEIESSLENLNVSALVLQIGGLGATYPSFVTNNADLRFTIDTATEEWLHQYLAFEPLGFRYVLDLLGISRNINIPTLNETVAGLASQELGALVFDKYYSTYNAEDFSPNSSSVTNGFDYSAAMRDIRRNVDSYLSKGQADQAEKYMEEQRQFLADKGYYIRKLNQAYFAFYGSYAYNATSVDPIGSELRLLRKYSPSIKSFIDSAASLTNSQDLSKLVSRYQ